MAGLGSQLLWKAEARCLEYRSIKLSRQPHKTVPKDKMNNKITIIKQMNKHKQFLRMAT